MTNADVQMKERRDTVKLKESSTLVREVLFALVSITYVSGGVLYIGH
jgi:hypothetical protein